MSRESIKVVCRLRPENKLERDGGYKICVNHDETRVNLICDNIQNDFTFDKVFGPTSKQIDVFNYTAKPIIDGVMDGYNGTLLAYGQTGSGKTFTMEGVSPDHPELKGIVPRMMEYVFDSIQKSPQEIEFTVKCSFLEIYNERLQDLLDPNKSNLMIRDDKEKGIWVEDMTEKNVINEEEMLNVFKEGTFCRTVAATRMNERSSRSHSLFILTIFQRNTLTEGTKIGKLYFVDLAGSEKVGKTHAKGQVLEEAKNINKSLMCLGMVINSLTEGKTSHIPYRDSKLTRILQESLGGNSLTTLIVAGSMSEYNDKESLSTLRFGSRVKTIKNKPIVNKEKSNKELQVKIKELEEKIKKLEIDLKLCKNTEKVIETVKRENEIVKSLEQSKCENCANARMTLLDMNIEISELEDINHSIKEEMVLLEKEIKKLSQEKEELVEEIRVRNKEIYDINSKLKHMELKKYSQENNLLMFEKEMENIINFYKNEKQNLTMFKSNMISHSLSLDNNFNTITNSHNFNNGVLHTDRGGYHSVNSTINISNLKGELMNHKELLNKYEIFFSIGYRKFKTLLKNFLKNEASNSKTTSEKNWIHTNFKGGLKTTNNSIKRVDEDCTGLINLNINKNININVYNNQSAVQPTNRSIIKSNSLKRTNSFSYFTNKDKPLIKTVNNITIPKGDVNLVSQSQSRPPKQSKHNHKKNQSMDYENLKTMNFNVVSNDNSLNNISYSNHLNKTINMTELYNSNIDIVETIRQEDNEEILNLQHNKIRSMENTIFDLEKVLIEIKRENERKESELRELMERLNDSETRLQVSNQAINTMAKKVEAEKLAFLKDLSFKDKQILKLHEKINDLEDANFKLVNYNKDKKKFYAMETQTKELTVAVQQISKENVNLKTNLQNKNEDLKKFSDIISDLETKCTKLSKRTEELESQLSEARKQKVEHQTLVDNYTSLKASLVRTNTLNANAQKLLSRNNLMLKSEKEASSKEAQKVKYFSDKNLFCLNQTETKKIVSQNKNIMRIIKGGGGQALNAPQKKYFFERHLSKTNLQFSGEKEFKPLRNKVEYEKIIQEKFENQMKLLSNEDDGSSSFHSDLD